MRRGGPNLLELAGEAAQGDSAASAKLVAWAKAASHAEILSAMELITMGERIGLIVDPLVEVLTTELSARLETVQALAGDPGTGGQRLAKFSGARSEPPPAPPPIGRPRR